MENSYIILLSLCFLLNMTILFSKDKKSLPDIEGLSLDNNSAPVKIPDLTRGTWNNLNGLQN